MKRHECKACGESKEDCIPCINIIEANEVEDVGWICRECFEGRIADQYLPPTPSIGEQTHEN